jgi:hypothetical protein
VQNFKDFLRKVPVLHGEMELNNPLEPHLLRTHKTMPTEELVRKTRDKPKPYDEDIRSSSHSPKGEVRHIRLMIDT